MRNPHHQDKSDYARLIGYTGKKPVIVCDGKVISHRNIGWLEFCHKLHKTAG